MAPIWTQLQMFEGEKQQATRSPTDCMTEHCQTARDAVRTAHHNRAARRVPPNCKRAPMADPSPMSGGGRRARCTAWGQRRVGRCGQGPSPPARRGSRGGHHMRCPRRQQKTREAAEESAEAMAARSGGGEALVATTPGQHLPLVGIEGRQP